MVSVRYSPLVRRPPDRIDDQPMETAVTGAYGHLGANLVHELVGRGDTVRAIDVRKTTALEAYDVEHIHADTTDLTALESAFAGVDVVYHAAARISVMGDPDGSVWRTNVDGVAAAGRAALTASVDRFVHVSSVHALDLANAPSPVTEDASPSVRDSMPVYDRSKAMGERFISDLVSEGLNAVIVRPSGIIGPGDHDVSRMGAFLRALHRGRVLAVVTGGFDWVDVRDVANAMIRAGETAPPGRSFNIGGTYTTIRELTELVANVTGMRPPRLVVPMSVARRVGRPATWWARRRSSLLAPTAEALETLRNGKPIDISRAAAELGHTARPLEETLRDFFTWLEESTPDEGN